MKLNVYQIFAKTLNTGEGDRTFDIESGGMVKAILSAADGTVVHVDVALDSVVEMHFAKH